MLKFYIISTVICVVIITIIALSVSVDLKREGYIPKYKSSLVCEIRALLPFLIPFINIILALISIFIYESLLKAAKARCIKEGTPMTRLEKAKELRPGLTEEKIVQGNCPFSILPMDNIDCPKNGETKDICPICWNEEYKE